MAVATRVSFPTRAQAWTLLAGFVVAVTWCVAAAWIADFELGSLLALAAGPFLTVLAGALGCALLYRMRGSESPRERLALTWISTIAFVCAFLALGAALPVPTRALWDVAREAPTFEWSQAVVGRIQTYEAVHGGYPASLGDLGDLDAPWWAHQLDFQVAQGEFSLMVGRYHGSDQDPRSGFNSRGCNWIVRGEDGYRETPVQSVPYWESLRYLQHP